jgi:hypothetical protein
MNKILKMSTLVPMAVKWEDGNDSIVLVDIISEKSFNLRGEELSDSLSTPIQEVIQSKKVQLQKQSQEATDEYRKDSNANKIIDEYLKGRG